MPDQIAYSVLWIMPELNHYRINLFNELQKRLKDLTLIHADTSKIEGHLDRTNNEESFTTIKVKANYKNFGIKPITFKTILTFIRKRKPNFIFLPLELKNTFLVVFFATLKYIYKYKMVSYNHDFRSYNNKTLKNKTVLTVYSLLITLYDKIIFYTKKGMELSISEGMIKYKKAGYANNTIDTGGIINKLQHNKDFSQRNMIFIGRFTKKRKINIALEYFNLISKEIGKARFYLIGNGPLKELLKSKNYDDKIEFITGTTNEDLIAEYMDKCTICLNPGSTGLSILHCFAYGVPVVTLDTKNQPPEIDYLKNNFNGIILNGNNKYEDCRIIINLLNNENELSRLSKNAIITAKSLSIENWAMEIITNLSDL